MRGFFVFNTNMKEKTPKTPIPGSPGTPEYFSRSTFLKFLGTLGGAGILVACGSEQPVGNLDAKQEADNRFFETEPDKIAYATVLLGGITDSQIDKSAFPVFEGWKVIKSNLQGKQVVYYNSANNSWLKLDLRPDVATKVLKNLGSSGEIILREDLTAIEKEILGQRASVRVALGVSEQEAQIISKLKIAKIATGETLVGIESKNLGISVDTALKKGLIQVEDIPQLAQRLSISADEIYQLSGFYNKDLNAGNVLINNIESGEAKLIVVDWTKTTRSPSISIKAAAIKKFFDSMFGKNTINQSEAILKAMKLAEHNGRIELKDVLLEIAKRENIGRLALKTAKGSIPIVTAIAVALWTAEDARAGFEEAIEQKGNHFLIELAAMPLMQSGMPDNIAMAASDRTLWSPGLNGFHDLPYIPLGGINYQNMMDNTPQGDIKQLDMRNNFDDRFGISPMIWTGLSIIRNETGLEVVRTESQEAVFDGENINFVMMDHTEKGVVGYSVYEFEYRKNFQGEDMETPVPHAFIMKRLALFVPKK